MFNVGVSKKWLKKEYEKALSASVSVPCDEECSNCGVCSEFDVKPSIKSKNMVKNTEENKSPQKYKIHSDNGYKYRLEISKTGYLKFISHLDWQKLIYNSIRKSGLKINYSQGFNPSPKISIGIALPLFIESENEYINIELQEEIAEHIIKDKLNNILPETSQISRVIKIFKNKKSIEEDVCWAVYEASPQKNFSYDDKINIETIVKKFLLKDNITINKPSPKGTKKTDIRPSIYSVQFNKQKKVLEFILKTGRGAVNSGGAINKISAV
ncbi:MAG: TIGR03936 family radical SAM-associated protein, partial [Candidatus Aenigmarchaeota archaeon]|nr:TIGR03936 family radical SAM-associated protein [Candidatus Aenigmarchaeota archaeon]